MRRSPVWARGLLAAALAFGLLGCRHHAAARSQRARPQPSEGAALAGRADAAAQRMRNLHTRLHPLARALVLGADAEAGWVDGRPIGVLTQDCVAAVGWPVQRELDCSLVPLGDGRAALLVQRERGCEGEACLERNWVLLPAHGRPVPLPARKLSHYRALRSDLSPERATRLWLAGFRGIGPPPASSDAAHAQRESAPSIHDYAGCTVTPDERELWCGSGTSELVGIEPLSGSQRVIARLDTALTLLEPGAQRVPLAWTAEGVLTARVWASQHPLCGADPCELLALIAWPARAAGEVRVVRALPEHAPAASSW